MRGGIGAAGLVVLVATLATLLPLRVLARVDGRGGLVHETTLVSASLAVLALATFASGPAVPGRFLPVLERTATAISLGGALLVALALAYDNASRWFRIVLSIAFGAGVALVLSSRTPWPVVIPWTEPIAMTLVAVILVARHRTTPEPVARSRLVLPAVGTATAATTLASVALAMPAPSPVLTVVARSVAVIAAWLGIAFGVWPRGRTLAVSGVIGAVSVLVGGTAGALLVRSGSDGVLAAVAASFTSVGVAFVLRARWRVGDAARMTAASIVAREATQRAETPEDLAAAVLEPLRAATRDLQTSAEMWVLERETRYVLDVAGAALPAKLSFGVERALLSWLRARPGEIVFTDVVRPLEVRRPEHRALIASLAEHQAFAVVPLREGTDLSGALLIPRGRRRALPTHDEQRALEDLSRATSVALANVLALARARERAQEADRRSEDAVASQRRAETERDRVRAEQRGPGVWRAVGSLETAWVGYSEAMRQFDQSLRAAAERDGPVLLVAEAGVSVASIARNLHEASACATEPCVIADGASVHPRDALTSLLGTVRSDDEDGARADAPGWLELARGGTLVLVDLPALGDEAHHALLDVLRTGRARRIGGGEPYEVRARIVATARASLVGSGVPAELCERLGAITLTAPALRDRADDIETLVLFAIDRACRVHGRPPVGIRREALSALRAFPWPGNEVELFAVIESAVGAARGVQVILDDLPETVRAGGGRTGERVRASVPPSHVREPDAESYDALERRILQSALERANGNKSVAARTLGLARTTFLDKLRKYGLRV
jgi:DNA-binding NtrC family response regulator